jgi:UrcA family protein
MRATMMLPALLLACASFVAAADAMQARVVFGDLQFDSREGRAVLRQRVTDAAQCYCALYGAETTPYASRADLDYCSDITRSWIVSEMRPQVRRAYFLARREASVRGRAP